MLIPRKAKSRNNPVLGPLPPLSVVYNPSNVPNYANPRPFVLGMRQMV
jgi:hypothetical protein